MQHFETFYEVQTFCAAMPNEAACSEWFKNLSPVKKQQLCPTFDHFLDCLSIANGQKKPDIYTTFLSYHY